MNMKPLFLGVILAASCAHAASTEVSAKPVTGTAASAEVKTADVAASQEANNKTLTAQQTATDKSLNKHSDKKVTHKKVTTEEKENTAAEKAGKEKTAEHKITAEKKKNTVDKQEEQKATAPTTATKTE
ncbi:hypothetical protein HKX68_20945 [Dickeya dadantii]|uniref:hypothetical protein n=1 Tax=Dickeya dadantii TaxID=204038 RepID=UPI001372B683|nr:hypothetical protein [Dickeya dadantii]NAT78393.1 hypothetical protein [Dickeya dadantii]NPE65180.1 hypothetical protein [Dickeya dadantii]